MARRVSSQPERSAASFVPPRPTLRSARSSAARCKGCELWRHATQTVFGEGRANASVLFVGEQPGDAEDLAGKPFVGPAGRVLDRALEAVGIARDRVYVTNVVKHFKWEPRGKRRIHSSSRAPWCVSARRLRKPCSALASRSRLSGGSSWTHHWRRSSWRPYIHRPFCARRPTRSVIARWKNSSRISERSRTNCSLESAGNFCQRLPVFCPSGISLGLMITTHRGSETRRRSEVISGI